MPGRVSVRQSQRASAVSRKSSTQTLKSRASSTRNSAQAVEIPDEGASTTLRQHICGIFGDAQRGTATQRKLAVILRKIQEECCYEVKEYSLDDGEAEFGEDNFNEEIARCLIRVLPVKKSEPVGDRTVRFLGLFLKYASDKDNAIAAPADDDATQSFPETPSSRLVCHILKTLLPLLTAKDKTVRFRATQITAHIVNTLDSIDDELFTIVRHGLLKRLRDKEAAVRVQAVLGLGRLADDGDEEDEDSDDEEERGGILQKLLDVLQNDPSAEVRRSLLLNLPFAPSTLPFLLERARDCDPGTRRALYARLLPALGDFRHLSLTHREKLLRWGLRDRDENVRKATARLFRERWIEDCAASREAPEEGGDAPAPEPGQVAKPSYEALLELLERVDVVNSGAETGIALEAMREFWEGRPDYVDMIHFDDDFWDTLAPESVFVARTFNDYCRKGADTEPRLAGIIEDRMPEVTRLGFILQKNIVFLIEDVQKVALLSAAGDDGEEDVANAEEDTVAQEFCLEQLLHIALTQDFTDEIGRRKMFGVMREALALAELPEECTRLVVEVLRATCGKTPAGEREFCEVVLEAVAEVHDTIMGEDGEKSVDDSFHSATSHITDNLITPTKNGKKGRKRDDDDEEEDEQEADEDKAVKEIMVNMKCLHIAQCMLQNVECQLENNSHLVTMLNNLVVPAVRSQEAPIRERGLLCLGLCCLLSKNLAEENLTLFLHCFNKGSDALQIISLQIITDILTSHPTLLPTIVNQPNPLLKALQKMFSKSLKSPTNSVQTNGAVSLSKLLLSAPNSLDSAPDLLKQMLLTYFDPDTRGNASLRQALSYFLPVFCHSRRENAAMMATIAVGVVHVLHERQEEAGEEEEDMGNGMVGLTSVGAMVVDWTDGRKGVDPEKEWDGVDAHVLLAEEILDRVLTPGLTEEERKSLMSMLGKLHIPQSSSTAAVEAMKALLELVNEAIESKLSTEASTRNALNKLSTSLTKHITAVAPSTEVSGEVASGSGSGNEAVDADGDVTMTTVVDTPRPSKKQEQIIEEEEEEEEEEDEDDGAEGDTTAMTMTTEFAPDAEGTRIVRLDEEDEVDEEHDATVLGKSEKRRISDRSLLDSLLDSADDVA
ncbi:ARM repeat-containing protein [Rhizodiscina lignyota]|uniref:ARM repeat-containing protein n=1 Tax=Rhizodiscina lignyota TaxID=1504668 RepID=A0A9P4I734_9PEZI|nr:ARM repeat-containing protein [Rhizodiscina lignyota]